MAYHEAGDTKPGFFIVSNLVSGNKSIYSIWISYKLLLSDVQTVRQLKYRFCPRDMLFNKVATKQKITRRTTGARGYKFELFQRIV